MAYFIKAVIIMDRENDSAIKQLAKQLVNSQSFGYKTFEEAKGKISVSDYWCIYDKMTLLIYEHNIPSYLRKDFCENFKTSLFNKLSKEEKKQRKELVSLYHFIERNEKYKKYEIEKCKRPDFVLKKNDKKVGIEVTELIMPDDKLVNAIMDDYTGTSRSTEEIKSEIQRKHGKKVEQFSVYNLFGTMAVSGPVKNVGVNKDRFVYKVVEKYNKYKNDIADYDEFIILCDERGVVVEITDDSDIEDIIESIKDLGIIKGVTISFIYTKNYDNNVYCKNVQL